MANDYRILDERDIKNFQAGNKLNVTEIDNKITYEHIGEPPNKLPLQEQALEYGGSFDITVPSVYDSTGHVKSETTYSFKMPDKVDTSSGLTANNFSSESPIGVNKSGKNITYSHNTSNIDNTTTTIGPNVNNTISLTALSAADDYGHATEKTTYQFQIPKAVDVSGYIKKDSFGSIDGNPVVKGENDKKQIAYSHKTLDPTSYNPATVNLEYDKEFQFTALSATDGYGHANQNTTYKFKMPKASTTTINTSDFLKKTELEATFDATDPLHVDITNNAVTYSHTGSSPKENKTTPKSLAFGGTFDITVPSAYNSTGHVTATQPYTFTMPATPTIRECIGIGDTNSFYYYSSDIDLNVRELTTAKDSDLTTIYFVTFYPGAGYSKEVTENNTKYTCAVISPCPFTIPVATYQNATTPVTYTFQALKFYPPSHQSKTAEKTNYEVTIQLKGDEVNHKAWFHFEFPVGIFSKITVMGF